MVTTIVFCVVTPTNFGQLSDLLFFLFLYLLFSQKLLEQLGEDNDSLAKDGPSFTYSKIDSDCRGMTCSCVLGCACLRHFIHPCFLFDFII
jgi:hypothetical protein